MVPGFPAPLPGESPLRGAGESGQRDGRSSWHQDNALLLSCLNNGSVHCCDTIRILGGCSTLGDSSGLALECPFFLSQPRGLSILNESLVLEQREKVV